MDEHLYVESRYEGQSGLITNTGSSCLEASIGYQELTDAPSNSPRGASFSSTLQRLSNGFAT